MRHVLCAHLPNWPIDRLRRTLLRASEPCRRELLDKPFVLIETVGNRQIVVHVSPDAPKEIYPGMTLAEARARHSELLDLPATPDADLRSLRALGHWLIRFSPGVSLEPPNSIFLDATGVERLFGGLSNFRNKVAKALAGLRITASLAIAPTAGATWALAACGKQICDISLEQLPQALAPLPPQALRLEHRTTELLATLGIHTIGALLALPRNDLAARFGPLILQRIDQALGAAHEPLLFLPHRSPIVASLEFEGAIESLDAIGFVVRQLTREVAEQLAQRGQGARQLKLIFEQPYGAPVEKTVGLARACRNESALFKLLGCVLETLHSSEGFIRISLKITSAQPLDDEQAALIGGQEERDAAALDHLVERLRARLDSDANHVSQPAVEWGELVESHLPEEACRSCDSAAAVAVHHSTRSAVDLLRPLRLLRRPRAVQVMVVPWSSIEGQPISFTDCGAVHRLAHARGPERITGPWWKGRWKTRDYFDVLDEAGNRYWIFRVAQSGAWFLHGIFE